MHHIPPILCAVIIFLTKRCVLSEAIARAVTVKWSGGVPQGSNIKPEVNTLPAAEHNESQTSSSTVTHSTSVSQRRA